MPKISFKPKQVTKRILSPLQDRSFDVIVSRFGLGEDSERKTLEAIGDAYNITRERVRQIEAAALNAIRKSSEFKTEADTFTELRSIVRELGALIAEEELLPIIAKRLKIICTSISFSQMNLQSTKKTNTSKLAGLSTVFSQKQFTTLSRNYTKVSQMTN